MVFNLEISNFPTVGHLLDKFPSHRHWLLFATVSLYGAPVALITSAKSVELFFALWLTSGVGSGGMVTGCNVYCLDTWRDSGQGWQKSFGQKIS